MKILLQLLNPRYTIVVQMEILLCLKWPFIVVVIVLKALWFAVVFPFIPITWFPSMNIFRSYSGEVTANCTVIYKVNAQYCSFKRQNYNQ